MKYRINLTVELDPTTYAYEYGIKVSDVRADLKTAAAQQVWSFLNERLCIQADVREV